MHASCHAQAAQVGLDGIPLVGSHDVQVKDMRGICALLRRGKMLGKSGGIGCRDGAAAGVLPVEVRQLGPQDCRLNLVQAAVHADLVADVVLLPAVLAQRGDADGERRVGNGDGPAIAKRAEVFGRIEAEGGGVAERADALPVQSGAVGLGAILDQGDAMFAAKRDDAIQVGRLARRGARG